MSDSLKHIRLMRAGTVIAAVLLSLLLAACVAPTAAPMEGTASGEEATVSGDETVELVYQDWATTWFPPMVEEMMPIFNEEHPNIQVSYVPQSDDVDVKLLAQMVAGEAPDLMFGCCTWFPIIAQKGQLLDLSPYVESDLDPAIIEDFDPAQYNALFLPDGTQYALPKYHGALALFYNKDLFDEYGVDYPPAEGWTLDEYQAAMDKLTQDTDGDGETDIWGSMIDVVSEDRVQMYINNHGGHIVNPEDPTDCMLDEPEAQAGLQWLYDRMQVDGTMATALDVGKVGTQAAFINGQVAMVEDGSWALKNILANAPFRVGLAPFPAGPAGRVTLATTDAYGIWEGTEHPDEAWALMKFLLGDEYVLAQARAQFLQPARASLVPQWADIIREEYPEATADLDIEAFADGHEKGYSVVVETFENQGEVRPLLREALDLIFTLGEEPVGYMADVCAEIEAAQSE
jgi:multiple sugar transport system substrate-binding protein